MEIIISMLIGVLLGNFATTILYRVPRNITICGFGSDASQPPFCSFCHHKLQYYEYLPVLSWINTAWRCNYCGHAIPLAYTALEVMGVVISSACYAVFGLGDMYILLVLFGLLCITNSLMYIEHGTVPPVMVVSTIVLGAIYRTLIEETVLNWIGSLCAASIVSIFLLKRADNSKNAEVQALSTTILLASLWTFGYSMMVYSMILASFYIYRFFIPNFKPYPIKPFPVNMILLYMVVVIHNINAYINEI